MKRADVAGKRPTPRQSTGPRRSALMFVCFLKIKEATVPGRPESRRTRAALSGLFQDQSGAADKAVRLLPLICRRASILPRQSSALPFAPGATACAARKLTRIHGTRSRSKPWAVSKAPARTMAFVSAGQTRGDAGPRGVLPRPVRVRSRLHVHGSDRHPSHPPAGPPRRHREKVPPVQVKGSRGQIGEASSALGNWRFR